MTPRPHADGSRTRRRFVLAGLACLATPAVPAPAAEAGRFWTLVREGGCIFLMRHARTEPGLGDPPGFRLGDCRTQRNLSAEGIEDARRVGERFAQEGVSLAQVRSSAWCRCTDTAQAAFGRHEVWPALNSFFQGQGDGPAQTRAVWEAARSVRPPQNWMLVTHQVNMTALVGAHPAMGEVFLTRPDHGQPGRLTLLARWSPA
jgi:broad specificity phosphatase PhoE